MKSLLFQLVFICLFVGMFLLGCAFFNARLTSADTVLFADNFLRNDLANWSVARSMQWQHPSQPCLFHGQVATWAVKNNRMGISIDGPPCITELIPKHFDLSAHPTYTYEFDWSFPESTHMDRVVLFQWHDANNWYDVKVLDNTVLIQKVIDGKSLVLPNSFSTFPFVANRTYHFTITVQDEVVLVEINGKRVLTMLDQPPFLAGFVTIGLQAGVGMIQRSISEFGHLLVHTVDDALLPVVPLKQTDPRWRDHEYDAAHSWTAHPTIGRWGCALTSMTMVLNFYGLRTLPDGTPLTPDTLNTWLKSQVDGYIGSLVNWLAVTRLTRLINQKFGTPKLEYGQKSWSVMAAESEISAHRPVILQMPGHFFVGNGTSADHTFIGTIDPFYDFTRTTQYPLPLLSVRTFLPSFTDLSYILIVHSPEVHVSISQNGHVLPTQDDDDTLTDPVDGQSSPHLIQTLLPKPSTGTYIISLTRPRSGKYNLTIYSYDQAGEPSIHHFSGTATTTPTPLQLDYQKTASSSARQVVCTA